MNPGMHRYPGAISHMRGTGVGIPQHLRGEPQLLIDTGFRGADVDCGSAGSYTIDGVTLVNIDGGGTEVTATPSGLVIHATQDYLRCYIELPRISAQSAFGIAMLVEPISASHQYGLFETQLCQASGSTDSQHDLRLSIRKTTSVNWRMFLGYRGSSSFTMQYKGDNPAFNDSGLPSRLQFQYYGHARTSQMMIGTGTDVPTYQSVSANANMAALVQSGSGITVGSTLPYYRYLRFGCRGHNAAGTTKVRIRSLRVWALGGVS